MKITVILKIVLLLWLVSACAASNRVTVKEYANQNISGKTLLIVPSNSISIDEKISTKINDVFGKGEPDEKYSTFFYPYFEKSIRKKSSFSMVYTDNPKAKTKLFEKSLAINSKKSMAFLLPEKGTSVVDTKGSEPDFVIFLSTVEVKKHSIKMEYSSAPGISQTLNYVFWDNRKGMVVSYGSGWGSGGMLGLNEKSFKLWTDQCVNGIISDSPFSK